MPQTKWSAVTSNPVAATGCEASKRRTHCSTSKEEGVTNQSDTNQSELQRQIAELMALLKASNEEADPVVMMGNSLAALAAAVASQTETMELLRSDVANLTNAIIERG
jgi:hypothetical protein